MSLLPFERASQLATTGPQTQWLVEGLWSEQAVGILGGEPKCCKSFLALDVAVSVASGAACLRQFPVRRAGSVLLFPAEDSLPVVRQRLAGIAAAAQVPFDALPVEVITAPSLRLDTPADRARLAETVQQLRPLLLILDPLIRLHRVDENDANPIAARRAIAEAIRVPLATLSDDDRAFIDALLDRSLSRPEILAAVRDRFPQRRQGGVS